MRVMRTEFNFQTLDGSEYVTPQQSICVYSLNDAIPSKKSRPVAEQSLKWGVLSIVSLFITFYFAIRNVHMQPNQWITVQLIH